MRKSALDGFIGRGPWIWAGVWLAISCGIARAVPTSRSGAVPTIAILLDAAASDASAQAVNDALYVELASDGRVQLVERAELNRILEERRIELSGIGRRGDLGEVGGLLKADWLLSLAPSKDAKPQWAVRLVASGSGKVLVEETMAMPADPFLAAAAVRKLVGRALEGASADVRRLTVGIAAFHNRGGTDRSDKLGLQLQEALRRRLRQEGWATVLERQYPTALVHETELTRMGLTRRNPDAGDNLPPADLVILGSMEDGSREYAEGQPWSVKLSLLVLNAGHSTEMELACRSDQIAAAAEQIVQKLEAVRQAGAATQPAEAAEKLYWRRHALYLTPRSNTAGCRAPFDVISERERVDAGEGIRAWENVLLLDGNDNEARLNLGVCLASLARFSLGSQNDAERTLAKKLALRGSMLVESAVRADPNSYNASTFWQLANVLDPYVPERLAEMSQFAVDHPQYFKDFELKYARLTLSRLDADRLPQEIERAVGLVEKDPDAVTRVFGQLGGAFRDQPNKRIQIASKYTESRDPVTRFFAEYVIAETLFRERKDPAALDHYDRMIEVQDAAYNELAKSHGQQSTVDDVYRYRFVACEVLGKEAEGRETILRGARHFLAAGRYNTSIGWVYYYAVVKILGRDDPKTALAICDAYLEGKRKSLDGGDEGWLRQVAEYKVVNTALLAGQPVPDFGAMELIKGTECVDLRHARMAVGLGRIWGVWQVGQAAGRAFVYTPGDDGIKTLAGLRTEQRAVAVLGSRIYFGASDGLYELDSEGKIVRHLTKQSGGLPSNSIVDVCAVGDTLYFSWRESDRYGVSALNPATGAVTVLAPSSREATMATEPVYDAYRIWWSAADGKLIINDDGSSVRRHTAWSWSQGKWTRSQSSSVTFLALSQGEQTLAIRSAGAEQMLRLTGDAREYPLELPFVHKIPEPTWDARRIWLPTYTGLYEISRATGEKTWLAHKEDTPCLAVVRLEEYLYVATTRGLYRYKIAT